MRTDVVIVGAGIGGGVLALSLARCGWRVALIERESAPPRLARPEILWSPTVSALERLGIAGKIRDASVLLEGIFIASTSRKFVDLDAEVFRGAGISAFSTNPSMTRAGIVDVALETGLVEIHRGVAVHDLLWNGARVVGVRGSRNGNAFELEARLVVGDDGVHSVVRKKLGIELVLAAFPIDFVTAPIRWPDELAPGRVQVWIRPKAFHDDGVPAAAFLPWPHGEGVLLLPMTHKRVERFFSGAPGDFWRGLESLTPISATLRTQLEFPRSFARVRRPFGHSLRYVADGAAIIGDAAHPMTPAGGQGANASIWDALALSDVADAALRDGDTTRERLLRYEEVRRPINQKSVAISRLAERIFRVGRRLPSATLFSLLAPLVPRRRLIRSFATTFVTPETR